MNKLNSVVIAAVALGVSASALADYYPSQVYAEVLSSTPVYQQVSVAQPRQECYQQQVVYQNNPGGVVAGTLIGGLIGGVLGHQIGGGSGRAWATGLGAVAGAGVGNNIARADNGQTVGYQPVCSTVADYHYEQRLVGYDVAYGYAGQVYHNRLPYNPGSQLLINVSVGPPAY